MERDGESSRARPPNQPHRWQCPSEAPPPRGEPSPNNVNRRPRGFRERSGGRTGGPRSLWLVPGQMFDLSRRDLKPIQALGLGRNGGQGRNGGSGGTSGRGHLLVPQALGQPVRRARSDVKFFSTHEGRSLRSRRPRRSGVPVFRASAAWPERQQARCLESAHYDGAGASPCQPASGFGRCARSQPGARHGARASVRVQRPPLTTQPPAWWKRERP